MDAITGSICWRDGEQVSQDRKVKYSEQQKMIWKHH